MSSNFTGSSSSLFLTLADASTPCFSPFGEGSKGFERDDIREAFRLWEGELDYDEARREILRRKYGTEKPEFADIKEKQKAKALLYRYGHDASFE